MNEVYKLSNKLKNFLFDWVRYIPILNKKKGK